MSKLRELIEVRRQNRSWEKEPRDANGRWTKESVSTAAKNYGRRISIRENLRNYQAKRQAETVARQQKKQKVIDALKNYGRRLKIRENLRQQNEPTPPPPPPPPTPPSPPSPPTSPPILKKPEEYISKGQEILKDYPEFAEYSSKVQRFEAINLKTRITNTERKEAKQLDKELESMASNLKVIIRKIGDKFLSSSPLSEKKANELADNINIKNINGTLSEIKQAKQQASNVYRLIGGGLPPFKSITLDKTNRPGAIPDEGLIIHNPSVGDHVIPHEMAHIVEVFHPELAKANNRWIRKRATGSPQKYRNDESIYPDNFTHAYVGKIYPATIDDGKGGIVAPTEVFSKGIEMLLPVMLGSQNDYSNRAFKEFSGKDIQHLELTLGAIAYLQEKNRFQGNV